MKIARPVFVAILLGLALTPRALCQTAPSLVAELRDASQSTGCCIKAHQLPDLPTKMGFNLMYDGTDVEIGGGALWFAPGETGFFDFDATNAADFGAFVDHLTNGVDETLCYGELGQAPSGNEGSLQSGCGPESSVMDGTHIRTDLAGSNIGFVRLVVNKVVLTHTEPDAFGNIQWSREWDATWQFWSGAPLNAGGGQRSDVDDFLLYANPLQENTALPASATSFNVTVFYGTTINAASFEATLNGAVFGGFHPVAGTRETVSIPLTQGRNILLLKVDGARSDGRAATDRDRLTFLIP